MTYLVSGLAAVIALIITAGTADASYICVEKKTLTVGDQSVSTPVVCVPAP